MSIVLSTAQKRIGIRTPLFQHFNAPLSSSGLTRLLHTSDNPRYGDFFRYTGGRWLWDEEKQLQERYKKFNVQELKCAAARSIAAAACVSITKLAEGGFNKVFRLIMNDGRAVIARLPNPNAGPAFRTTASEVATMDLARNILKIPVPEVLAWSGEASNPVGSEYILMEEASGTALHEVWEKLELEAKIGIVEDIVAIEKKLLSISFTRYGNLYYATDAFAGCESAQVQGDIEKSQKEKIERHFVIGPVVSTDFWEQGRSEMDIDRGPWKSIQDYIRAICHREITWLSRHAVPKPSHNLLSVSLAQNTPATHIALYKKLLNIADLMVPEDQEMVRSTIWHWDIHTPNLFITNGRVSSLIDWQDAWAGPLFFQAQHPRVIRYGGREILKLPDFYEDLTDEAEKTSIQAQVERSIVQWIYKSETETSNSILHKLFNLPHWRTRCSALEFGANTWDGDILPFQQCLINIVRHWDEFNANVPCPISFTDQELEAHIKDGQGWNERAEFWESLEGFVRRDGWTANEDYDSAMEMFAQLREHGLQSLTGQDRQEFEEQTRWARRGRSSTTGSSGQRVLPAKETRSP